MRIRAQSKKEAARCIYCANGLGTTRDHIPPSCFFPAKPISPITVPCCEECRIQDQKEDEFVRNLFTSTAETERHESVMGKLAESQARSYRYSPKKLDKLVGVTAYTPQGLSFRFDDPRVDRFIERMARAALYDAFQQPHFTGSMLWKFSPPETSKVFTAKLEAKELRKKHVGAVFSYVAAALNDAGPDYVYFRFYRSLLIAVQVTRNTEHIES